VKIHKLVWVSNYARYVVFLMNLTLQDAPLRSHLDFEWNSKAGISGTMVQSGPPARGFAFYWPCHNAWQ